MKVPVRVSNIKEVLYNRYKAHLSSDGRPKSKPMSFEEFSGRVLRRYSTMKMFLPERRFLFQYVREVFGIRVYEKGSPSFEDEYVSFWSNAAGDLLDGNKRTVNPKAIETITADELPDPLKYAYNNLWSENYSAFCYLVHTPDTGYGIALNYEILSRVTNDDRVIEDAKADEMFDDLVDIAVVLKCRFGGEVLLAERTRDGEDECHQLMIILPANPVVKPVDMESISQTAGNMIWGGLSFV